MNLVVNRRDYRHEELVHMGKRWIGVRDKHWDMIPLLSLDGRYP